MTSGRRASASGWAHGSPGAMNAMTRTGMPRRRSSRISFRMKVSDRRGKRLTRMASVTAGSTPSASPSGPVTGPCASGAVRSGSDTGHAPEGGYFVDAEAVAVAGGPEPLGGELGGDRRGPAASEHPEQLGREQV